MAEFDNLFKISVGGSSFQLADYSLKAEAVIEKGKGRTGTNYTLSGEGWVSGADTSDFATALAATRTALLVSGQNVVVTANGQTELELLAARCMDGGPHCSFEQLAQGKEAALVKPMRFTIVATTAGDGKSDDPNNVTHTYKVKVATKPDGLRDVTVTGDLTGKKVAAFFSATVLPFFHARYPAALWVLNFDFEDNAQDDTATYNLKFVELSLIYPVPAAGTVIVDGEATHSDDRDEQQRLVRTITYNFLVNGDGIQVRDIIRGQLPTTPLRERYEVTRHKEVRVTGEFQILLSGSGDGLLNWTQDLEWVREDAPLSSATFPGATPLVYYGEQPVVTGVQKGSAIGLGKFPKEPPPLYIENLAAPRQVTFSQLNEFEFQTSWEYRFVFDSKPFDKAQLPKLKRPAAPTFYEVGA